MNIGQVIGILGVALCVFACGTGSALGLYKTGSSAAGVLSEDPKKFGKVLVLVLLPATQGIYGFIIGILGSTSIEGITVAAEGWSLFCAALPMTVSGFITGYLQGRSSANCIRATGKHAELGNKLIIYPAMIEFYAILGLIISIMLFAII